MSVLRGVAHSFETTVSIPLCSSVGLKAMLGETGRRRVALGISHIISLGKLTKSASSARFNSLPKTIHVTHVETTLRTKDTVVSCIIRNPEASRPAATKKVKLPEDVLLRLTKVAPLSLYLL